MDAKNAALFERHGIFTETELESRYEILLENYCKTINIEALTIIDIVRRSIIPSSISYQNELADTIAKKQEIKINAAAETKILDKLNLITELIYDKTEEIGQALDKPVNGGMLRLAEHYCAVAGIMQELRVSIDALESNCAKKYWDFPDYSDLLYSVN
jgi:glutamine synthetase